MNEKRMLRVFGSFTKYDPEPLTPAEEELLFETTTEADAWAVVGDLKYLTPETLAILKERAEEWRRLYPRGEPNAKRKDDYQYNLYSADIADILNVSLRKAQKMLQISRKLLKKGKTDFVCVKEFCFIHHLNEEEFRKSLAALNVDED